MKMSDKEIDKLFSSQLAGLEVEPSAGVWDNIKVAIDNNGTQNNMLPWLQIAAGVIVLMAVALWLRPSAQKIALHGNYNAAAPNNAPASLIITPKPQPVVLADEPVTATARPGKAVAHKQMAQQLNVAIADEQKVDTAQNNAVTPPVNDVKAMGQPLASTHQLLVAEPVNTLPKAGPVLKGNKALAATAMPVQKDKPGLKRKKIRGVGSLLNVVIAKVDKRTDKIIQFKDDDDDDTFNVTSVNLGLIQLKKDN